MEECCTENKLLKQSVETLSEKIHVNGKSIHKLREKIQVNQIQISNQKQWGTDFEKNFDTFKAEIKKDIRSMAKTIVRILVAMGTLSGLIQIFI